MSLRIQRSVFEEILAHARKDAPIEACGYIGSENDLAISSIPLTNADHSPEHFSFDPAEQFAAVRALRRGGLSLCAVYHSHPASPARPSQEDIRLAYDPSIFYVIVSLAAAQPEFKAFHIQSGIAKPEPVEFVD